MDILGAKEIAVRAWDETLNTHPEKLIWNLYFTASVPFSRRIAKHNKARDSVMLQQISELVLVELVVGTRRAWMEVGFLLTNEVEDRVIRGYMREPTEVLVAGFVGQDVEETLRKEALGLRVNTRFMRVLS
ncbi:hypothetical protein VNO80_10064 [Phaseolus coccineus]|uniref:Moybdenum cofactor oxidoreductase dimerisation domain-containing protein n=1 Tax=Phaseolus coccineus TaxID=3886 RepID=A0AAN9RDH0_PHACN